jgi:GTP-binding nuclear protein Ran
MATTKNFKCVLIGDGGVGKTTFITRHKEGVFLKRYKYTVCVDIQSLNFNTSEGEIIFDVWDCAGQEKYGGLRDGYYIQADCAIIMFDLTSINSMKSSLEWYRDFHRVCPNTPVVLVGNKYDINDKKITLSDDTKFPDNPNLTYFNVSTKTGYNIDSPFECLARKLTKNENLRVFRDD